MKRIFYFATIMVVSVSSAFAQRDLALLSVKKFEIDQTGFHKWVGYSETKASESSIRLYCGPISTLQKPLAIVVFKMKEIVINDANNQVFINLSKRGIEEITVFKDAALVNKYGDAAKYGVIKIRFKKEYQKQALKALTTKQRH